MYPIPIEVKCVLSYPSLDKFNYFIIYLYLDNFLVWISHL